MPRTLSLPTYNRYRQTDLLQGPKGEVGTDEATFWGTFKRPDIILTDNDTFITIASKDNGRLDLLAHKYYGEAGLWWVIAMVNDIVDPLYGVTPGMVLRIPRRNNIFISQVEELL